MTWILKWVGSAGSDIYATYEYIGTTRPRGMRRIGFIRRVASYGYFSWEKAKKILVIAGYDAGNRHFCFRYKMYRVYYVYSADGDYEVTLMTKATVYCTGLVVWQPPTIYKSSCSIDVEYFPYDVQTCVLKLGSWTYDGFKVNHRTHHF